MEKQIQIKRITEIIEHAFSEDIGSGDVTTNSIVNDSQKADACWITKQNGIISGLDIAKQVFLRLDNDIKWEPLYRDGEKVSKGEVIVEFSGNCRAILSAERTALNIVQRMSGIATQTAELVEELDDLPVKILDTRKTVPGLRYLDKYAVNTGGGKNHRFGLYDLAMIKDNHIIAAGGITEAVRRVRKYQPDIEIEVETTNLDQVQEALNSGVDIIMLDNMDTETMTKAVTMVGKHAKIEASGNITATTIREVAETGIDYISVGALTHSVMAFDISQQIKQIT